MLASDHRLPPVLAEGPGASHGGAIVPSVVGVMHNLPSTESDPALLQGLTDHSEERIDQDLIGNADDDESEIAMILASFVRSQSHDSVSSSDEALAGLAEEAASTAMVQQEGKHSSPDLIDPRTSSPRAMSTDSTSGEDDARETFASPSPASASSVNLDAERREDQSKNAASPSSDEPDRASTLNPDDETGAAAPIEVTTHPFSDQHSSRRRGTKRKNAPCPIENTRVRRSGHVAALVTDTDVKESAAATDCGPAESGSTAADSAFIPAAVASSKAANKSTFNVVPKEQATGNASQPGEGLEAGPSTPKSRDSGSFVSVLSSYTPQPSQQVYVRNLCIGKKKEEVNAYIQVSRTPILPFL